MMNIRNIYTLRLSCLIPKPDWFRRELSGGLDETRLLGGLGRLCSDTVGRVLPDWR